MCVGKAQPEEGHQFVTVSEADGLWKYVPSKRRRI